MAQVRHAFESAKGDGGDSTLVQPSNWNEDHEGAVLVRKTGDESVTSSEALQDDDDLKFAVAANEVWIFDFLLFVTGDTAGDISLTLTVPSGAVALWAAQGLSESETPGGEDNTVQSVGLPATIEQVFGTLTGYIGVVRVSGTIENAGNAGDLQLQWTQGTSNGTATVVKEHSHLKAFRVA